MTLPTYTHLGGTRYRAHWGDVYLDVEEGRERGWPGLGSANGEPDAELYEHAAGWLETRAAEDQAVLDYGCGAGYGADILQARLRRKVQGADVDLHALAFAEQQYGLTIDFLAKGYERLRCQAYGAVVCIEVIEHIEDDGAAARALYSCLLPGGVLYLTTPERHPKRAMSPYHVREYTEPELWELLTGAGFTDLERHKLHTHMESMIFTARKP